MQKDVESKIKEGGILSDALYDSAKKCLSQEGSKLSIVMPCYNLANIIFDNVKKVDALFRGVLSYEIILVDDGSADSTALELRRAEETFAGVVKPIFLHSNQGKGAALAAGFKASRGSHILLLDGDLDLNPSYIWRFFDEMVSKDADVVIGSKMHRESKVDYPFRRRVASLVYYTLVKVLVGLPVHDTQTGMKLFKRDALEYAFLRMLSKRFAFDLEVLSIIHNKGYKVCEAPIELSFGDKMGCLNVSTVKNVMVDTLGIFYRQKLLEYYSSVEVHEVSGLKPYVSIVIACPGRAACLDECIQAIEKQGWNNLEVIVLPDESFEKPEFYPSFVKIIPTGKIRPAEKRNIGIKEARYGIIAFLDDDAAPLVGWLEHAMPYFNDANVVGVGGPAMTPPTDDFWSVIGGRVYANILVSGAYRRRYIPTRVCNDDDLPSCNLFVRKTAVEKIGGFDVRYWPGEDTRLCMQLVQLDEANRIVYDPWVQVTHHRRALFMPHLRQVSRYARHRGFFAKKGESTSLRLSYMIPSLFVLGLVFGGVLSIFSSLIAWLYFSCVSFYLFITFISSINIDSFKAWVCTWLGVMSTHVVYGVNFAYGWFAQEMESEVKSFDHFGSKEKDVS